MAHKARISGTNYGIKGGKCKVNGTNYSIKKGKTKISGTAYSISFVLPKFYITSSSTGETWFTYEFEEGMTLSQWIDSDYNTDGWTYAKNSNGLIRPSLRNANGRWASAGYITNETLTNGKRFYWEKYS